jgi:hypothetical protein
VQYACVPLFLVILIWFVNSIFSVLTLFLMAAILAFFLDLR